MAGVVHLLNAGVTAALDTLLAPFGALGPWLALVGLAAAAGAGSVWLWSGLTDPTAVRRSRHRLQAEVLAVRLFQQDVRVLLRIQAALLRAAAARARHAVLPVALMAFPVLIALVQLDGRCGRRPLTVGESALVTVRLRHGVAGDGAVPVSLDPGPGLALEAGPLRLPAAGQVVWRVRAVQPGRHTVMVGAGGQAAAKQVTVGPQFQRVSPVRTGAGWWALLSHPGEPPLPDDGSIQEVTVDYPSRPLVLPGWRSRRGWLTAFLLLSLGAGWLTKRWRKVEM